jgi:hypothetical protein
MSKDELLLEIIERWWDCIEEEEFSEGLDIDHKLEDIQKYYPEFPCGCHSCDEGNVDRIDCRRRIQEEIRRDIRKFFDKLRGMFRNSEAIMKQHEEFREEYLKRKQC